MNLDGPFYLSQLTIPHMKKEGWGRIVNICSYAWKSGGVTSGTAYSSSKAGLVGLTFTVAKEVAEFGVDPCVGHSVRRKVLYTCG